ncbi:hypothetical protein AGMMS50249_1850 [candidate division SR1 bacterium]|nr:hypothetical protein AGMMS50249_1850 [candidate division SR1 bacterium]
MKKYILSFILCCLLVFSSLSMADDPDTSGMPGNTAGQPTDQAPVPEGVGSFEDYAPGGSRDLYKKTENTSTTKPPCDPEKECCGIKLNTDVPIIGNCIKMGNEKGDINPTNAFPTLMGALIQIITSVLMVIGFLMIIVAGVMMTMGGADTKLFGQGKDMIFKVGTVIALLGLSGVILKFVNPYFFN